MQFELLALPHLSSKTVCHQSMQHSWHLLTHNFRVLNMVRLSLQLMIELCKDFRICLALPMPCPPTVPIARFADAAFWLLFDRTTPCSEWKFCRLCLASQKLIQLESNHDFSSYLSQVIHTQHNRDNSQDDDGHRVFYVTLRQPQSEGEGLEHIEWI